MARISIVSNSPPATEASPLRPDPSMSGEQRRSNGAGSSNRPLPTPPASGRSPRDIRVTLEILSHDGIQIHVGETSTAPRTDQDGAGSSSRSFGPRPPTTRIDGLPGARQISQDNTFVHSPTAPAPRSSYAGANAREGGRSIPPQAAPPAGSMSGNPLPRPPNDPWRDMQARMHQPTPTRPIGPHGTWPHGILRGQGATQTGQSNPQSASAGGRSGDAQASSSTAAPSDPVGGPAQTNSNAGLPPPQRNQSSGESSGEQQRHHEHQHTNAAHGGGQAMHTLPQLPGHQTGLCPYCRMPQMHLNVCPLLRMGPSSDPPLGRDSRPRRSASPPERRRPNAYDVPPERGDRQTAPRESAHRRDGESRRPRPTYHQTTVEDTDDEDSPTEHQAPQWVRPPATPGPPPQAQLRPRAQAPPQTHPQPPSPPPPPPVIPPPPWWRDPPQSRPVIPPGAFPDEVPLPSPPPSPRPHRSGRSSRASSARPGWHPYQVPRPAVAPYGGWGGPPVMPASGGWSMPAFTGAPVVTPAHTGTSIPQTHFPGWPQTGMPTQPVIGPSGLPMNYPNATWVPPPIWYTNPSAFALPHDRLDAAASARMASVGLSRTASTRSRSSALSEIDNYLPLLTQFVARDRNGNLHPVSDQMAYIPASVPGGHMLFPAGALPRSPFDGPRLHPWINPNPANPAVPVLQWDIRCPPELAKRVTARRQVVSAESAMSTSLTVPEVKEVQIVYQANMPGLLNYFGPIHLRLDRAVTFRDALRAIYDFFQVRLRTDEAEYFQRVLPEQWREWSRAFYLRCATAPHIAVRDAERNQGMRRVDCLGDRVKFWGLWITHNPDRTWQIQLGLDSLG